MNYTTPIQMPLFQDNLGKPVPEKNQDDGILVFTTEWKC